MKEFCDRNDASNCVTLGTNSSRDTIIRFRDKFLKEAHNIAKLDHPNIIKVNDIFEENGTAYYVMEYAENGSLADKINQLGCMSESVATHFILQVADALAYIHGRNMNHLDVKPANIMLNRNDKAVLIDFGLSKQYDIQTGNQTSTTPVGISEGYAPMEQYKQGGVGEFSPETDIYSLGATFFKLLTGKTPPSASDVMNDGLPINDLKSKGVSQKLIDVISKSMATRKKERFLNVTSFIECLKGNKAVGSGSSSSSFENDETTKILDTHTGKTPSGRETKQFENNNKPKGQDISDTGKSSGCLKKSLFLLLGLVFFVGVLFFYLGKVGDKPGPEPPVVQQGSVYRNLMSDVYKIKKDAVGISSEAEIPAIVEKIKELKEKYEASKIYMTDEERESLENSVNEIVEIIKNSIIEQPGGEASQPANGNVYSDVANGVHFNIVFVQGGTFKMGATSEMENPYPNEFPVHSETVNDFYIGQTEVTQALWKAVMGYNPSHFIGDDLPVENVSLDECLQFVGKLRTITGRNYRLPKEAEWEYAARGGNKSRHTQYSGSNYLNDVAWYLDNSGRRTHPVRLKKCNELGIYDMTGNVCEWCCEWYSKYDEISKQENVVVRDASWNHDARKCRISDRGSLKRTYKGSGLGLRIVL